MGDNHVAFVLDIHHRLRLGGVVGLRFKAQRAAGLGTGKGEEDKHQIYRLHGQSFYHIGKREGNRSPIGNPKPYEQNWLKVGSSPLFRQNSRELAYHFAS
jgi:hypothetical protein